MIWGWKPLVLKPIVGTYSGLPSLLFWYKCSICLACDCLVYLIEGCPGTGSEKLWELHPIRIRATPLRTSFGFPIEKDFSHLSTNAALVSQKHARYRRWSRFYHAKWVDLAKAKIYRWYLWYLCHRYGTRWKSGSTKLSRVNEEDMKIPYLGT